MPKPRDPQVYTRNDHLPKSQKMEHDESERFVMQLQSKYFSTKTRAAVIQCTCGQTLIHNIRVPEIHCPTCGAEEDLVQLVSKMMADAGTTNPEDFLRG